jgi:hypothetical protein
MNVAARGLFCGMLLVGLFFAAACGSERENAQETPPVFVDAAADRRSEPVPCNLASPSCPNPASEKCTIVDLAIETDSGTGYAAMCIAELGDRGVGEPCERREVGHDNCVTGALCSTVGLAVDAASPLVCRKVCITPEQCPAPDRCYRFSLGQPEIYGMCVAPCQPLDTDCGTGRHCIFVLDAARNVFGMCDTHGSQPEGAACNQPQECERGMACVTDRGCRQYCDATRPCTAADRACTDLGLPAFPGLGVCLPIG